MKLTYEARLDDSVETGVRLYLRSTGYRRTRLRGAVVCAAMFAAFAFLGFHAKENVNLALICAAAAAWGAGLFLLSYKGAARRRIQKYMTTEMREHASFATTCEIEDGRIIVTTGSATRAHQLDALKSVNEDARYLELDFGDEGSCVIPLRAFRSADEKAQFVSAIES